MTTIADCPVFRTLEAFYADDERRRWSAEWDYGVHWAIEPRDGWPWPRFRVSWVVDTGDLYAFSPEAGVILLGNVARIGNYPHSGKLEAWSAFHKAQPVERLLSGWAEQDDNTLQWILDRLAKEGS